MRQKLNIRLLIMMLCSAGLLLILPPAKAQTTIRTIQSDDSVVQSTGSWTSVSDVNASGGRYVVNSGAASLALVFSGPTLEVIYVTGPEYGAFAVEVDGALLRTVNANGPAALDQRAVFDYLSAGEHNLRVYPVNGAAIALDAFVVQNPPSAAPPADDGIGGLGGPHDPSLVVPLFDPFGGNGDQLGYDVDIDGDLAIVGAPFADQGAANSGAVYVSARINGLWTAETVLYDPAPNISGQFGHSVAIDGNFAIVGAPGNDTAGYNAGRAYIYQRDPVLRTWTLRATLPPSAAGEEFGTGVALDGNIAVVGAPSANGTLWEEGAISIYRNTGAAWVLDTRLPNPEPSLSGLFGADVAVSGDYVVAGARINRDSTQTIAAGEAFIFRYTGGTNWVLDGSLYNPSPTNSDYFGASVAIDGLRMVVGEPYDDTLGPESGAVHVYERVNGSWQYQALLQAPASIASADAFGREVTLNDDVMVIASGHSSFISSGYVHIYQRSGPTLLYMTSLSTGLPDDSFGFTLALNGFDLIVGVPTANLLSVRSGAAFMYDLSYTDEPDSPLLDEGNPSQTGTFSLSIPTAPLSGNVVFDISTDGQCTVSPAQVTFSAAGSQDVTVAVINDDVTEDPAYLCAITSSVNDALSSDEYDSTPDQTNIASIFDNDAPATGLGTPTSVSVDPITPTRIDVAWVDNSSDEDGFRVDRSTNSGQYLEIATVGPNVTAFSDTSVSCGQQISYRVRAERGGEVSASSVANALTQCAPEFIANVGGTIPGRAGNCSRTNTRVQILMDDMLPGTAYNIRYVFADGGSTYFHTRTLTATVLNPTASLVLYPSVRDDYGVGISNATTMPDPIFLRYEMESAAGGPSTCQRLEVQYSCTTGVATVISESNDCSAFPN